MVYNYTIPRGPIAAMYSSPGPKYGLPGLVGQPGHDPRNSHRRGPAYPFGIRHGKFRDDCSPGPCYLPDAKIFRDGKDGTPHYSLYARPRDQKCYATPGAPAYRPEDAGQTTKFRAPAYSFGIRHRHRRTDSCPAPNQYDLDTMTGKTIRSNKNQAPIYSLTGRSKIGSFHEDLQKTPGAGTYNVTNPDIYRERRPFYSMTSRNIMPGDTTQKPGPGAHSPERVRQHLRSAPAFCFGIRHSDYKAPAIFYDENWYIEIRDSASLRTCRLTCFMLTRPELSEHNLK